ncbi:unnamed protein product [Adineta steineri]|uniref:Methyltransferase-like protein n=1 Tax=Adineta steineri TaxID=433720 RepID=A0A819JZY1_9BILA|nr:unnamed protein product [Adineta steineri]CAF3940980.1 unnamed protein product [Adineta steineri]
MDGDITAELNFFDHTTDDSPPWIDLSYSLSSPLANFILTPTRITIHDLRNKEKNFNLDIHGFEVHKYKGNIQEEFPDNSEIQQSYYEELTILLKERLGASRVIVFNHVFRHRGPLRSLDKCDINHKNPAFNVHVDFDESGAHSSVKEILGEEQMNKCMQYRYQFINIWRPIGPNVITKHPLTICDYRSLNLDKDIHSAENRRSSFSATSSYLISHNPDNTQKWYYLSEMKSNEMFIFKTFDSNFNVARFCAHTGFTNDYVPTPELQQASIETRCLVLYDQ